MAEEQLSMLNLMEPPPALMIESVDPFGPVIQGDPQEYLCLPCSGNVNPLAEIELHQHTDGRWMWSASYSLLNCSGSGYKVGPKWGRFAATRQDALRAAVDELASGVSKRGDCTSIPKIISWARRLQ